MPHREITHRRKLRKFTPLWADTPRISVPFKKNPTAVHYNVVVVGAGISGALMANALADGRRRVLVIDRREPVRGSSLASTAMIQHEIDVPLYRLERMIGFQSAARVWQRSARAVRDLVALTEDVGVSCQMQHKRTLYLAGDVSGPRALKTEQELRARAGIDAEFVNAEVLFKDYGIDRKAALVSNMSASANPAQMTAGFLRAALQNKAEIVGGVEVTDLRATSESVVLATNTGCLISADHVVFCTGYEVLKAIPRADSKIVSTWAVATEPHAKLPAWLSKCLVWEGSDPYVYFRTTRDGRLIAGGEDEKSPDAFKSEKKLHDKSKRIVEKVEDLLRCRIGRPEYQWAGAFGTTRTGMPMIGAVPGMKNVYAVMGFGGNGITFSKIAAEIVSGAIRGRPDPDEGLFAFH